MAWRASLARDFHASQHAAAQSNPTRSALAKIAAFRPKQPHSLSCLLTLAANYAPVRNRSRSVLAEIGSRMNPLHRKTKKKTFPAPQRRKARQRLPRGSRLLPLRCTTPSTSFFSGADSLALRRVTEPHLFDLCLLRNVSLDDLYGRSYELVAVDQRHNRFY